MCIKPDLMEIGGEKILKALADTRIAPTRTPENSHRLAEVLVKLCGK
jgi:hypothetical protein